MQICTTTGAVADAITETGRPLPRNGDCGRGGASAGKRWQAVAGAGVQWQALAYTDKRWRTPTSAGVYRQARSERAAEMATAGRHVRETRRDAQPQPPRSSALGFARLSSTCDGYFAARTVRRSSTQQNNRLQQVPICDAAQFGPPRGARRPRRCIMPFVPVASPNAGSGARSSFGDRRAECL